MSAKSMSEPKPEFWSQTNARAFQDGQVARAYRFRPFYPPETFQKLAELATDRPRRVLDLGCGTGGLARHLVEFADHVDAVDFSPAMIAQGKQLPNGSHPKLNWIAGRAEDISPSIPYALVTAGDSLHWMDWDSLMPRLPAHLSHNGVLAICIIESMPQAWESELHQLFRTFSTISNYQALDLVAELERRDLFTVYGRYGTAPVPFVQPLGDYIESFHARSGFAYGRMTSEQAGAFDEALRELLEKYNVSRVETPVTAKIVWGLPHARGAV